MITDGLPSYHVGFNEVYSRRKGPENKPLQVREITIRGKIHNNKMERMNGKVRDREKMRGLKTTDSPTSKGFQLYHVYFRPYKALDGKTPAEAAGITIEGENKWETTIRNAVVGHLPTVAK